MPNTREKLIELIQTAKSKKQYDFLFGNIDDAIDMKSDEEYIADHLIANGVTIIPVNVGDTVYTNFAMRGWYLRDKDRPYSARVCFIGLNNAKEMGGGLFNVVYGKHENMMQFRFSDIGKSVFLTKEEAEEDLLKRRKGE